MLRIVGSRATKPNEEMKQMKRRSKTEDNLAWLRRALATQKLSDSGHVNVLLLGGTDQVSFRLRVAQSHVRSDMEPSYWSHALLLTPAKSVAADSQVYEISLDPQSGFRFPAPDNGIQKGTLGRYGNAKSFPNIAVIGITVEWSEVDKAITQFPLQRTSMDALDLIIRWLAFTWGVGRSGNPLLEGAGVPSAAFLETIFGAAGFDLTPGLESRSSCPEAIWQASRWWHDYYEKVNRTPLRGAYVCDHWLS